MTKMHHSNRQMKPEVLCIQCLNGENGRKGSKGTLLCAYNIIHYIALGLGEGGLVILILINRIRSLLTQTFTP